MSAAFIEAVVNLGRVIEVLTDDVEAEARAAVGRDDRARRACVRAIFAYVEGTLAALKKVILEAQSLTGVTLAVAEVALLREETYTLDDQGNASARPLFVRTTDSVRFTFATAAKVLKSDHSVSYAGKGWVAFRDAIRLRNRLTHPRTAADCEVSEADLDIVMDADSWYRDANGKCLLALQDLVQNIRIVGRS